ncbi:MAG: diguanylate cyclase [Candidatus Manganitrophaceae bacterium]|nr:MAG: diguanylate cyclase [Candidatus Manganitrophaceae bacterium]
MTPPLRIALFSPEKSAADLLELRLRSKGHQVVTLLHLGDLLGFIYSDPPDLLIIDLTAPGPEVQKIVRGLKDESHFSVIPIIGLIRESTEEGFDWSDYPLDDFIVAPIRYPELFSRVSLSLERIQRVFDHNPLTKLPGNTSIQKAIEKALGKPMAVCYIDVNHFKPYNDTFGFARGDEVLRMLARIMSNAVKETGGEGFAGHVGGDDFVFIVSLDRAESVCKKIIDHFNIIISDLFSDQEKSDGFYIAKDRKGETQEIPLLGIAIAVVPTSNPKIRHYGMISAVAAELKKYAKQSTVSRYVIDRRKE